QSTHPSPKTAIFPGAMFSFVDRTMIGRKTRPTPPSAKRTHAAKSWKIEPFGTISEYEGSRVSPAPRAIVSVVSEGSPSSAHPPLAAEDVRSVPYQLIQRPGT